MTLRVGSTHRAALAVLAACALVATGCSTSGQGTGTSGYVSGSGAVTLLAPADRNPAPDLEGTTLDGASLALDDYSGQVVVINVWASWCPPCRSEASDLVAAARSLAAENVQFVGIDTRDTDANARSFVRDAGVTYPSIVDPHGQTLLGFDPSLAAVALPSTLVLDAQHRVAARVLGPITATTLRDLVLDVAVAS
jgi:thiol-disulfide isomerase/thioredoxin